MLNTYGERREEILAFLEQEGVVFGTSEKYRQLITECCAEAATVFPELFDELSSVFFYDQDKQQRSDMQQAYATFWYHTIPSDRTILFSVGVSSQAAAAGKEDTLLYILHELAHLKDLIQNGSTDHNLRFHAILDMLIDEFNQLTGHNLENDYFGLDEPLRHYDGTTQARLSGYIAKKFTL